MIIKVVNSFIHGEYYPYTYHKVIVQFVDSFMDFFQFRIHYWLTVGRLFH